MKALLIVAGLFFSIFGAVIAYFAASDPGHEYDLKFVLPIDARQMPKPVAPPPFNPGVPARKRALLPPMDAPRLGRRRPCQTDHLLNLASGPAPHPSLSCGDSRTGRFAHFSSPVSRHVQPRFGPYCKLD